MGIRSSQISKLAKLVKKLMFWAEVAGDGGLRPPSADRDLRYAKKVLKEVGYEWLLKDKYHRGDW